MPEKNQPVVFIVDDERVIADTLSIILSKSGFSTMTAYDGESALELARAVHPDLLISDVVMPEMTGVDLAIAVTETVPGCKVLLFSGQAAIVDLLEKARRRGHDFTILTKPVHPTDMLRRISECLEPITDRIKKRKAMSTVTVTVSNAAKAVVRRNTEEVQGKGDFNVFDELFAEDFVDHTTQPGTTPDKAGVRKLYIHMRGAFSRFPC
jgi:DNA-binding NtrC family response regulator